MSSWDDKSRQRLYLESSGTVSLNTNINQGWGTAKAKAEKEQVGNAALLDSRQGSSTASLDQSVKEDTKRDKSANKAIVGVRASLGYQACSGYIVFSMMFIYQPSALPQAVLNIRRTMSTLLSNPPPTSSSFHSTHASQRKQSTPWRLSRLEFEREVEPLAVAEGNYAAQLGAVNTKTPPPRAQYTATLATSTSTSDRLTERTCKTVLIFIGKSGSTKAECAEFSDIRPEAYELLAHFLEESGLKPKLSYLAEEYILIVEMLRHS
ncbi:hypothetical protein BDR03DRAFT_987311 [Suillus americanus]|nr:hypothetical protein BDR03DRAFT_987311 [Suillus americanus]